MRAQSHLSLACLEFEPEIVCTYKFRSITANYRRSDKYRQYSGWVTAKANVGATVPIVFGPPKPLIRVADDKNKASIIGN